MSELERKEVNNEELDVVNGGSDSANSIGQVNTRVMSKGEEQIEASNGMRYDYKFQRCSVDGDV